MPQAEQIYKNNGLFKPKWTLKLIVFRLKMAVPKLWIEILLRKKFNELDPKIIFFRARVQ